MAVEFKGLDEVMDALDQIADAPGTVKAMQKACALVEAEARKKAPKGNGALRNSIESRVEVNGDDIIGVVFTSLEYAPYVEYGTGLFAENGGRKDVPWCYKDDEGEWHSTSGMKPHPFMRPAFNENREKIKEILGESIKND